MLGSGHATMYQGPVTLNKHPDTLNKSLKHAHVGPFQRQEVQCLHNVGPKQKIVQDCPYQIWLGGGSTKEDQSLHPLFSFLI